MSGKIAKSLSTSKPIRMWIDGKCFNIKPSKLLKSKKQANNTELTEVEKYDTSDNNQHDILESKETGKFSLHFELPSLYYTKIENRFLEFDVKSLSEKTKTEIVIPKYGNAGRLIVTGENKENVENAVDEIHSFVANVRDTLRPLQFVGIPMKSEELFQNFETFKKLVLKDSTIKGMDESIFQKTAKLHLTVAVMVLLDEKEKKEASNALDDYKMLRLGPLLQKLGPTKVVISGINCMNSNLKKVDVLYANAKIQNETEDVNLQKIIDDLSNYFYDRGLLKQHQESVKLHVTLINSKYRKDKTNPLHKRTKRQSFDATSIMENYKDFYFGTCNLNSIHISYMSGVGDDGFYKPLSLITF